MKINILKSGDRVLGVTTDFLAVERSNGEVDILPLIKGEDSIQIDMHNTLTIGYEEDPVQTETINGVTIMNF